MELHLFSVTFYLRFSFTENFNDFLLIAREFSLIEIERKESLRISKIPLIQVRKEKIVFIIMDLMKKILETIAFCKSQIF